MHQFSTLAVTFLASCALAAPAPKQQHGEHAGHFTAAVHGPKSSGPKDPLAEMKHVFGKYDWTFDVSKFEVDIPHIDLSKLGNTAGQSTNPYPQAAGSANKEASNPLGSSQDDQIPDLFQGIGSTLGSILGGDHGGNGGYPDSPDTTLSTVVKPTKTKKVKPTAASSMIPTATASSSAVSSSSSPPAYTAPSPEPTTQSTTEAAPSTTSPSSTSTQTSSTTTVPVTSPSPTSSSIGTYTPSYAFDPTTSAETEPTSAVEIASSAMPTTSSVSGAPSSTKSSTGGKVTATPEQNESEYLSPVSLGGQSLNLNFDTGSADLWVFSSSLNASQSANHATFDPSKSSTWKPASGYSWSIAYGDGSTASGTVGFDTVVVGGATATSQAVEIATAVSDKFTKDANNDGLVGLAFSSINTVKPQQQKTFFENIMPNLDQPLFTADLRQDTQTSTYEFGVIDSSKYTGDIHYTPIDNSQGHWQFTSTTYTINGQSFTNSNAAPAIADTGTSLILADQSTVTAYYGAVSGAAFNSQVGGYTYSCSATLPDFGIQIGSSGYNAVIPGSQMTYAPLGDGNCFGGLQSNGGGNYQILGDVLFKQYFAVFNGGEKTFGVALKA